MAQPLVALRAASAAALFLLSACGTSPRVAAESGAAAESRPPNVIFILADDLGYGDVGAFGQRQIATPRLDQMASEGMRLTDHYTGAPVCAPARSVLMTGQHMGHTTVRGNHAAIGALAGGRVPLRAEDVTVAEVLKGAGYTTGIIGKWGLGEPGTSGVPAAQGFDHFFGYLNQKHAHTYYPDYLWRNGDSIAIQGNRDGRREVYSHDLMVDEALQFVERNRERPFFLYLALTLPHAEVEAPDDSLLAAYRSRFPETEATFAAMVSRLDRDVGQLLDHLARLGIAENTLVIFSSDNGPHREGGHDPEFFDSNGPLRGIKRDLYEGGIRVPTIAWWPGRVRAGSASNHPSAFWDFLPTAAELAGAELPAGIDGTSYVPALLGQQQARREALYWEFYEGTPAQAVRMGRWKAIRRPAFTGAFELYDLEADPGETRDLASRHPEIIGRMREVMEREHVPSPHWGLPAGTASAGR